MAVPMTIGTAFPGSYTSLAPAFAGHAGRFAAVYANIANGIVIGSVYMWTGEGWPSRNMDLMWQVVGYLHGLGHPWVLGGDFQMAPAELLTGPPMQHLNAELVAPPGEEGTCRQGASRTTIDYFLVHKDLVARVDRVAIQEAWPSSPHKPVSIFIKADAPEVWQRVVKQPSPLPLQIPIGCAPRPP